MKEWKRKIASLLMVSMLLGNYAQTAVYAAEPEGGDAVVSDDEYGFKDTDEDAVVSGNATEDKAVLSENVTDDGKEAVSLDNVAEDEEVIVPDEELLTATPESDFEWDGNVITKYNGSAAEVVIPKRAEAISENSFNSNKSITTLSFEEGSRCKSIMIKAFHNARNLSSANLPESLETIAGDAFYRCDLRELTIPTNVTMIGYGAFSWNSSLSKVTIESKEFELEANGGCFHGCSIDDVSFPDGMTKIPAALFSLAGLKDGTRINIPDSVTEIGEYAFNNVSNSFTIGFPANLETIGAQAFYHSALSGSVFFPVTIKEIGTSAFNNCSGIDEVIYAGTRAQWDAMVDSKKIKSGNEPIMNPRCLGDEIKWDMARDSWGFKNYSTSENGWSHMYPNDTHSGEYTKFIIDFLARVELDIKNMYRYDKEGKSYRQFVYDEFMTAKGGHCYGMATSAIANKMGYRDIADILYDVPKEKAWYTITCFHLGQYLPGYLTEIERILDPSITSEKAKLDKVVDMARSVAETGPALLTFQQSQMGRHAVVIYGIEECKDGQEWEFPYINEKYKYKILIYDNSRPLGDSRHTNRNMYINANKDQWFIPNTDWDYVYAKDKHYGLGSVSSDMIELPNAKIECITKDPSIIYPVKFQNNKLDSKALIADEEKDGADVVNMPEFIKVSRQSMVDIAYGDWRAKIVDSELEDDGRGICFYDDYCEEVNNDLPLNVFLPDVVSHETMIMPAEGDSTTLGVKLLVMEYYLNASAEKVAGMGIEEDGSYTVSGNDGAFEISLTSNNQPDDCYCTYTVSGNNKGDFSVSLNAEGGITVTGDDLDGMTVTASDIDDEEKVIVISDEDGDGEVVIPGDKDEEGDNDDVYAHSALDSQPVITEDTEALILVKGQKFVLGDNQWTSSDKKVLAISKTKATAKKAGTVTLTHGTQTVKVTVIAPAFDSKSVKMTAGEEKSISLNNASGLDILYVSLSPDVAVVDEDGTVTAISKGSAVINAYVNGAAYKYTVKVSDADTSKRDFTKPVELKPMQAVSVKLKGFKASKAAWSSETQVSANELPKGFVFADSVVKISKSGKITAIGAGETVLTATGGSAEPVVITIRVSEPLDRTMHINVNDKKPLRLYGVKGNVEWKPAEDGIVTVEKNKVKALKAGDTVLTAKVEGFTYTVTVYIEDAAVITEGISGKKNKYTLELNAGCSAQLSFASLYQQVAFKSGDCSVAYADEDGVIHARKAGSAKLSGKISGKAVTITVKVQKYDEKAASLEEYVKSMGFTVYGYGSERYSDTDKSVHQNLPKPYKVLWHAKLPNPEFPAENLAYVRLVEINDGMISIDVFSSVYDGVNMLCPMEVACEVIDKLVNDPYVETTEGEGPFYYFPPYSQYIKYDFTDFY